MGEHYIEKCACGIIVSQCRCPEGFGEKKSIRIVKCTHPNPPVTDAYTKEAVEWMNAPTGPMPNLAMTDARREPVTETDVIAAEHIIASAHYKSKDWTNVYLVPIEQHRALADRLAAAEETNRIAALHLSEMEQRLAASEKADYDVDGVIDHLKQRLAEVERERDEAERALRGKGYRKECDIPACNCGPQWNHGGHAESRLREIDEALPYENGKTILTRVEGVVQQLTDAQATMAKQAAELEAIRDTVGETEFALRQQVARLRAENTKGKDNQ